ncbi:hypothetical protein PC129_g21693 [Phytophthora cactorum]|uniref:Uncharacterized protein n=1 Tax=Phytophthora cactorum TaxID=29920 RepID=A0A8T1H4X7_9STRA|nr:hypothetical protein Pcac1_g10517 [Phytophthora cactorum]KAG3206696.1 hypothetical protein PC129_g21693 [Phytophthora cactorum]
MCVLLLIPVVRCLCRRRWDKNLEDDGDDNYELSRDEHEATQAASPRIQVN